MYTLTITELTIALSTLAHQLTLGLAAAPPPLDPTNLIKDITSWLIKILAAVGALYFVVDLFKHIASSPRDIGAAGKDALVMVVLLAVAAKGEVLITWAQSAL